MVSVLDRINTIKSYSNYIGHDVSAHEIENAVVITITSYRSYGNKAYEYVEMWIVPNATLDTADYLTKEAYPLKVSFTSSVRKVFVSYSRRWRRKW